MEEISKIIIMMGKKKANNNQKINIFFPIDVIMIYG